VRRLVLMGKLLLLLLAIGLLAAGLYVMSHP